MCHLPLIRQAIYLFLQHKIEGPKKYKKKEKKPRERRSIGVLAKKFPRPPFKKSLQPLVSRWLGKSGDGNMNVGRINPLFYFTKFICVIVERRMITKCPFFIS